MANGQRELDKVGCEYGRKVERKVENIEKEVDEMEDYMKTELRDIKTLLSDVKQRQDRAQFQNDMTEKGIQWLVRGTIVGFVSYLGYLIMQVTDKIKF